METYILDDKKIVETIKKIKNHLKVNGQVIVQTKNARDEKMRLNFKDNLVYRVKVEKYPEGKLKIHHFIDKGEKNISESVYDKYIMSLSKFENRFLKSNFNSFNLTKGKDFYIIN